jgi:type I restriction enzyme S subunit
MNSGWRIYSLDDVLFHDVESLEQVVPDKVYEMVGVYSYGKGLFDKEELLGLNTSYKNFYRLRSDHIVMSQLFGWEGAIAMSNANFEGKYVSTQFPTFIVNSKIANRQFVGYYLQTKELWQRLFKLGKGMGSRRRTLNPSNLLSLDIQLPGLPEQDRIIRNIESVKVKSDKIRILRREQQKEIRNFVYSKYCQVIQDADWEALINVAPIIRRYVDVDENDFYPELGIRSFGKGTFHKAPLSGFEVGTKKIFQIKSGDLLFSNVFAWEGAIAVAQPVDNNRYGSHRFISCEVDSDRAVAEFLCYHFLTPQGMEDINKASPGGAGRNKTLGLNKLMSIRVPLPLKERQVEFAEFQKRMSIVSDYHLATLKGLDELFPALLDKSFKGDSSLIL